MCVCLIDATAQVTKHHLENATNDSLYHYVSELKKEIGEDVSEYNIDSILDYGTALLLKGESGYARDFYLKALEYYGFHENVKMEGRMFANIGFMYEQECQYESAIEYLYKALDKAEEAEDGIAVVRIYSAIASVYEELREPEKAMKYYFEALDVELVDDDLLSRAAVYNGIGVVYDNYGDQLDSAFYYYDKSISILRSADQLDKVALGLGNIANIYIDRIQYDSAKLVLDEALSIARDCNQPYLLANILRTTAFYYLTVKDISAAEKYFDEGFKLCEEYDFITYKIAFLETKAGILRNKKEYEECIDVMNTLQVLHDSIRNTERNQEVIRQEIRFNTKKEEYEKKMAQQDLALSRSNEARKGRLLAFTLIAVFLTAFVTVLLILKSRLNNKYQKANLENKLLRSQMNPHFMFNALGAIQNFMLENNSEDSMMYLLSFSRLMRNILDASRSEMISIDKEFQILKDYLDLQMVRFNNSFEYIMTTDDSIQPDEVYIPPMLVQPFVENAVEHGVTNYDGTDKPKIFIDFKKVDKLFIIEVADNCGGFNEKSKEEGHISHATNITKERLNALNSMGKYQVSLEIEEDNGIKVRISIRPLA